LVSLPHAALRRDKNSSKWKVNIEEIPGKIREKTMTKTLEKLTAPKTGTKKMEKEITEDKNSIGNHSTPTA
jgi:hypothetical protein